MKRILASTVAVLALASSTGTFAQTPAVRRDAPAAPETCVVRSVISVSEATLRVSVGRPGRFLGASDRCGLITVRWEYPGGRVADIFMDGRTGRILGER